jgi:hypothetical protein
VLGNKTINVNGEKFPAKAELWDGEITISYDTDVFDPGNWHLARGKINSVAVDFTVAGKDYHYPQYQLKCVKTAYGATFQINPDTGNIEKFWRAVMVLHHRPDTVDSSGGHDRDRLAAGVPATGVQLPQDVGLADPHPQERRRRRPSLPRRRRHHPARRRRRRLHQMNSSLRTASTSTPSCRVPLMAADGDAVFLTREDFGRVAKVVQRVEGGPLVDRTTEFPPPLATTPPLHPRHRHRIGHRQIRRRPRQPARRRRRSMSDDLVASDYGDDETTAPWNDVLALNVDEIGWAGPHTITPGSNTIYPAFLIQFNSDGRPVVGFFGDNPLNCGDL